MASFYALIHSVLNLFTFSDAGPAPNSPTTSYHAPPGTNSSRQRSSSNATASGSRRSRSYSTSSRAGYDQSSMNEFSAEYVNILLPGMTVTMAPSVREKRRRRGEQSIRLKRWSGEHDHHERERSASAIVETTSRTPSPQRLPPDMTRNALLDKEDLKGERRHRRHTVPESSMSPS